jgi:hypothetical protein
VELKLGYQPPDKAQATCLIRLTEECDALDLLVETISLFTFPEPLAESDMPVWANDLSDRAYSYAGLLVATVSRELAIAAPILLPPFRIAVSEGAQTEVSEEPTQDKGRGSRTGRLPRRRPSNKSGDPHQF